MRETIEKKSLSGTFRVTCKYEDGTYRVWEDDKERVAQRIRAIVSDYSRQGYKLTLRQLHYQFVSRNWIVNHDTAYKKLGTILTDCKYAGVIDWNAIEDRGRVPRIDYSVDDIADALQDTVDTYKLDRQRGQKAAVELWTEKDAISNILQRVTSKYHVRLVVNKGYTSSSAIYQAYQRFLKQLESGQSVVVLYFGDHDPSGLDMVRDIEERLTKFICCGEQFSDSTVLMDRVDSWYDSNGYDVYDIFRFNQEKLFSDRQLTDLMSEGTASDRVDVAYDAFQSAKIYEYLSANNLFEVRHIGLTMEQVEELNLPPNPTKATDKRSGAYIAKYGRTCWEVDALPPAKLTEIVTGEIEGIIDLDTYSEVVSLESEEKEELKELIKDYK